MCYMIDMQFARKAKAITFSCEYGGTVYNTMLLFSVVVWI